MFGKMTLKKGINAIVVMILLTLIVFQVITYYLFYSEIREQSHMLRENTVSKFSDFINTRMDSLETRENYITSSNLLYDYITDMHNPEKKRNLSDLVYTLQSLDSDVLHVSYFDNMGSVTGITNNISAAELSSVMESYVFYRNSTAYFKTEYSDFFADYTADSAGFYILRFSPVYYHDFSTARDMFLGTLCVFAQVSTDSVYQLKEENESLVIDMHSGDETISIVNYGEIHHFSMNASFDNIHISQTNWYFSGSVGSSLKSLDLVVPVILLIGESMFLLLLVIGLNRYLNTYILNPFGKMYSYVNNLRISEKFSRLEIGGNTEMHRLSNAINDMVLRNKELANQILENQNKIYTAEASRKDAIIYALQNQINPHYMYNIFELIRSIACVYDVKEIEPIVFNTAEILRYNLNDGNIVTVADEYDIAQKYLEVMNVKFNGKFHSEFNLPDDILDKDIMKMTFQPIVENAFNHGYIKRTEPFVISISGHIADKKLILEFCDNGRGIDSDKLEKIRLSFAEERYVGEDNSIGLKNLHYRLKTFYGDRAEMRIESEVMKYTKITIEINM